MRNLAILLGALACTPFAASAQAESEPAAAESPAALVAVADPMPDPVVTPEPEPVVTPEPELAASEREFGLYVGVGVGSNLSLGGGAYGYQLEASIGMFYWIFAAELLTGTTFFNSAQLDAVSPHVGGALRVAVIDTERVDLQLGLGVRRHRARDDIGEDHRFSGGLLSARLLLPITENIVVRVDSEYERAFGGPLSGAAKNRLMFGIGLETRIAL